MLKLSLLLLAAALPGWSAIITITDTLDSVSVSVTDPTRLVYTLGNSCFTDFCSFEILAPAGYYGTVPFRDNTDGGVVLRIADSTGQHAIAEIVTGTANCTGLFHCGAFTFGYRRPLTPDAPCNSVTHDCFQQGEVLQLFWTAEASADSTIDRMFVQVSPNLATPEPNSALLFLSILIPLSFHPRANQWRNARR